MDDVVVVTGGAGYIGVPLCVRLAEAGAHVRALDVLLHNQQDVLGTLNGAGVELIQADIRDTEARERALTGARAVVHLAAIVGDPACARGPGTRPRGQRRGKPQPCRRRRAARCAAVHHGLDVLELRPHGRSDNADRRAGRARAGVALRRAEGRDREDAARPEQRHAHSRRACASPPSTAWRRGCASTSP